MQCIITKYTKYSKTNDRQENGNRMIYISAPRSPGIDNNRSMDQAEAPVEHAISTPVCSNRSTATKSSTSHVVPPDNHPAYDCHYEEHDESSYSSLHLQPSHACDDRENFDFMRKRRKVGDSEVDQPLSTPTKPLPLSPDFEDDIGVIKSSSTGDTVNSTPSSSAVESPTESCKVDEIPSSSLAVPKNHDLRRGKKNKERSNKKKVVPPAAARSPTGTTSVIKRRPSLQSPHVHERSASIRHRTVSQLINEEIDCDNGLLFLDDYDHVLQPSAPEKVHNQQSSVWMPIISDQMASRFDDRKGVVRRPRKPDKREAESTPVVTSSSSNNSKAPNLPTGKPSFVARLTLLGVSVHLGTYKVSSAAAAAVDIANIYFWGSDFTDVDQLEVLSKVEVWRALLAAGAARLKPTYEVEPFNGRFNQTQKEAFQHTVQQAIGSIGGADEDLAYILMSIDSQNDQKAQNFDKMREESLLKTKTQEKKIAKHHGRKKAEKKIVLTTTHSVPPAGAMFSGDHGEFQVDSKGLFSWRKQQTKNYENKPIAER